MTNQRITMLAAKKIQKRRLDGCTIQLTLQRETTKMST